MKFEKMIKKKIEIKTKIAPGKAVSPKTASNSFFRTKTHPLPIFGFFKKFIDNLSGILKNDKSFG